MAAVISSTGTWSTLGSYPTEQRDTTSDNYTDSELDYKRQLAANIDGYPELMSFIGLASANWSTAAVAAGLPPVPAGAVIHRLRAIINSLWQTQAPEAVR